MKRSKGSPTQCRVIIGSISAFLAVTVLLIIFHASTTLNNWILAYSTIGLVLVTLSYAIQTQRLVQQEKANLEDAIKRRDIDFLERKIGEFYAPFMQIFSSARETLHTQGDTLAQLLEFRNKAQKILMAKGYLISNETYQKIDQWLGTSFLVAFNKKVGDSYEEHKKINQDVWDSINKEWGETENRIREYYGVPFIKDVPVQRKW